MMSTQFLPAVAPTGGSEIILYFDASVCPAGRSVRRLRSGVGTARCGARGRAGSCRLSDPKVAPGLP